MIRSDLPPGAALRLAFTFLTRFPVPAASAVADAPPLAAAAWAFPVVGAVVGAVGGGALLGASGLGLHPLACALIAVAVMVVATGALHEDGLADVADGFGGGGDRDRKLAIMRDSRIGTYGVLALVLSVGLRVSLLASMIGPGTAALSVVVAAVLSRAAMVPAMTLLPPARDDGLGAGAGRPGAAMGWIALGIGGAAAIAILWPRESLFLSNWAGVAAIGAAVLAALAVGLLARRQIGGQTGDVLGTVQQAAEVSVLAAIAAGA